MYGVAGAELRGYISACRISGELIGPHPLISKDIGQLPGELTDFVPRREQSVQAEMFWRIRGSSAMSQEQHSHVYMHSIVSTPKSGPSGLVKYITQRFVAWRQQTHQEPFVIL